MWLALLTCTGYSQQPPASPQAQAPPATRAGAIERERKEKAARLAPPKQSAAEHMLDVIESNGVVKKFTGGTPGLRVHLGGLIPYAGFGVGPEYFRPDLLHNRVQFRTSIRASTRKFYLMDAELNMPTLAAGRGFLDLYAVHRNYPEVDYYGPGPNSAKSGRSDYLLEDTLFQATPGIRPARHLRLGAIGQYYLANVSHGRASGIASTDQIYTEQTTPGIQQQTDFLGGGGFINYDWRDNSGGPRRGGYYTARYVSYSDILRGQFAFSRLDMEAQQYESFFNQRRVIALRARFADARPHSGQAVPFYLQPTLGGPDDLRGFRAFRFYDNAAVVFNAEYRWEVFSGLDMALFADGGKVAPDWRKIDFRRLETDVGFGFRFNVRNTVFLRLDTAFSHEGFQVWFKFSNVF